MDTRDPRPLRYMEGFSIYSQVSTISPIGILGDVWDPPYISGNITFAVILAVQFHIRGAGAYVGKEFSEVLLPWGVHFYASVIVVLMAGSIGFASPLGRGPLFVLSCFTEPMCFPHSVSMEAATTASFSSSEAYTEGNFGVTTRTQALPHRGPLVVGPNKLYDCESPKHSTHKVDKLSSHIETTILPFRGFVK